MFSSKAQEEINKLLEKARKLEKENRLLRKKVIHLGGSLDDLPGQSVEGPSLSLKEMKGMVPIKTSMFIMGALRHDKEADNDDERPAHKVKLKFSLLVGKYQVTQALWESVMGENPSHFKGRSRPVERVGWLDGIVFCNKLSAREGLKAVYRYPPGLEKKLRKQRDDQDPKIDKLSALVEKNHAENGYRLPTEAEWEFCSRAGEHFLYSGSDSASDVAWFGADFVDTSKKGNSFGQTHPVGQKSPNRFGLYDMSGNVWEWVWDWKGSYSKGLVIDPHGPSSGTTRVSRGGCWRGGTWGTRVSGRYEYLPSYRNSNLGFRLVRTIK